ncbi:MAG: PQQ-binding-like beta-propeller repeat protein [Pirellulaceae bacterium]
MIRILLTISLALGFLCTDTLEAENWPGWRGPRGDGTSIDEGVPTEWDGATGKNILWKTPIPGKGHASPIIWKDRVFVVSCLPDKKTRVLVALDRRSGKPVWQTDVLKADLETKHSLNSRASGTPVTDGKLVYVTFFETAGGMVPAPNVGNKRLITPGRMVVAAYDFDGNLAWRVTPGEFVSAHGYCSSPVIFQDLLIVNGDHDGESYVVALQRKTGKTVWKVARQYKTRSYVTPLIRNINGQPQMVMSGSKSIVSLDPRSGEHNWKIEGPTEQFVASMVYDGELFFMSAGFPTYHVMGIRPDGKGDVTDSHVAWHVTNARCYVPSPVLVDGHLFVADDRGTANCFHAKTGERLWQARLGNHFSASLLAANGYAYLLADDGTMTMVRPGGTEPDVVAVNKLGEFCFASPAISQHNLFIRGEKNLYCIGTTRTGGD